MNASAIFKGKPLPVVRKGDPILTANISPLTELEVLEQTQFCFDLLRTMYNLGVQCITANMVGENKRIIVIQNKDKYQELINPQIIIHPDTTRLTWEWERCAIDPKKTERKGRMPMIRVRYYNRFGKIKIENFTGKESAMIQQGLDFLSGKPFFKESV